jgi:hypothetical protein
VVAGRDARAAVQQLYRELERERAGACGGRAGGRAGRPTAGRHPQKQSPSGQLALRCCTHLSGQTGSCCGLLHPPPPPFPSYSAALDRERGARARAESKCSELEAAAAASTSAAQEAVDNADSALRHALKMQASVAEARAQLAAAQVGPERALPPPPPPPHKPPPPPSPRPPTHTQQRQAFP